jgi:hypothetical protein
MNFSGEPEGVNQRLLGYQLSDSSKDLKRGLNRHENNQSEASYHQKMTCSHQQMTSQVSYVRVRIHSWEKRLRLYK